MRSWIVAILLMICSVSPAFSVEVRLSVAASMTDAVKTLLVDYGKQVENITFLPNFGSSGALAKQIEQGAPADIFISANSEWMDYLVEKQRIQAETVRPFAYNSLVFVGDKSLPVKALVDLEHLRHIAIGSPKSVPAGQYAEQALRAAGLYQQLQAKLVMAKDVRQALMYADRGEADGAFVYRTDALLAENAVILLEVPQNLYAEVTYPIGLTVEGAAKPEAAAFYAYLKTTEAQEIMRKYGFVIK